MSILVMQRSAVRMPKERERVQQIAVRSNIVPYDLAVGKPDVELGPGGMRALLRSGDPPRRMGSKR
jgi:hypothetical protein